MRKISLLTSVAAVILLVSGLFAQTASADDSTCVLGAADFTAIRAIQNNPNLSSSEELSQELTLRKQLLSETITCAVNDAQSLQAGLNTIPTPDSVGTGIKSQLADKIGDTINFYNLQSAKLNGTGISGTEAIAKEMIAWRTANYDQLPGDVSNFALWSENQALFQTAQNRLTQTGHLVAFIEVAAANSDLSTGLQIAQSSFQDAQNTNAAAAQALSDIQPSDESLALIQQSLQSLAAAYQKFANLNDLIQTLLPTQQ